MTTVLLKDPCGAGDVLVDRQTVAEALELAAVVRAACAWRAAVRRSGNNADEAHAARHRLFTAVDALERGLG